MRPDNPWSEPTTRSREFARYTQGKIFDDEPWNRIEPSALGNELYIARGSRMLMTYPALLREMLTVDPQERIKLSEISSDPWFDRFAHDD